MPGPLISLVMPNFNGAAHLREAIDSILHQDYPHVELWVMDAASTDESVDILRSYGRHPRLRWESEGDRGQSHAINKGLERARGELFYWVNADDYLEPGSLRIVAEAWEQGGQPDVICGQWRKFDDYTGETTGTKGTEIRRTVEATILAGTVGQGIFYRTPIFRELGGVREDLHCAMDVHLWVQYLVRYGLRRVASIPSLLAHFRQHPASKSATIASRFKHEINATFLDLYQSLGAPEFILQRLRAATSLAVEPPTCWRPGPHLDPSRLFAAYCDRWVRLYYRDEAYRQAAIWLRRQFACRPRLTPEIIRFSAKLLWHYGILRRGFRF
jgi:glycosyltransferase involved in cell wall biosynthesis